MREQLLHVQYTIEPLDGGTIVRCQPAVPAPGAGCSGSPSALRSDQQECGDGITSVVLPAARKQLLSVQAELGYTFQPRIEGNCVLLLLD